MGQSIAMVGSNKIIIERAKVGVEFARQRGPTGQDLSFCAHGHMICWTQPDYTNLLITQLDPQSCGKCVSWHIKKKLCLVCCHINLTELN